MDTNVKRKKKEAPGDRHRAGDAARALPHAGRAALLRKARLRSVSAEPGERHQPSLARPGGDRRGIRRGDASRRLDVLHVSRPRPHAGARRIDGRRAGRVDGAPVRPAGRQGRLDAPDRRHERRDGFVCDHRRASAGRGRRGMARAVSRHRAGRGVLLRRRHHQHRRVPRSAQFLRGVEAAGDFRVREQSLHGIHADPYGDRGRSSGCRPRVRLRPAHRSSSTATTPTRFISPR